MRLQDTNEPLFSKKFVIATNTEPKKYLQTTMSVFTENIEEALVLTVQQAEQYCGHNENVFEVVED